MRKYKLLLKNLYVVFLVCLVTMSSTSKAEALPVGLITHITGNTYYLDAVTGKDTNNGSQLTPWKTLGKAQSVAVPGDCVVLSSGNYGTFKESDVAGRNAYIIYTANKNSLVNFDTIHITNTSSANSFLIFNGINVRPNWIDPASSGMPGADDPKYPGSTLSTYAKTSDAITITNASYVKIIDCTIEGQSKHLTVYGVTLSGCQQITVDHCVITKTQRGVNMQSSSDVAILNSHIHDIGASGIVQGNALCSNVLIDGNHIHNSKYSVSDDYAPRALNQNYHGSGVAIRNGNIIVRNNVIHDGFVSSGIMCYNADIGGTPHFDNVTIENNLVYDIHTPYVLRFYLLGNNVVVRNNTLIGYLRTGGGEYRYNTALAVHSLADDGAHSLTLNNNIFIGTSFFAEAYTTQKNNIFYSWSNGTFQSNAPNNSTVLAWSYSSDATTYIDNLFACGIGCDFNGQNGKTQDFSLATDSPALNFGDVATQTPDGIGWFTSDGFLVSSGSARTASKHSAGAFETITVSKVLLPPAGFTLID